jgi:hypothetical protein
MQPLKDGGFNGLWNIFKESRDSPIMQHMIFAYATPEVVAQHIAATPGMESPESIKNGYRLSIRRSVASVDVQKNLNSVLRDDASIRLLSKRMGGPSETVVAIDMEQVRAATLMEEFTSRLKQRGIPYFSGVYSLQADPRFEYRDMHHPYS